MMSCLLKSLIVLALISAASSPAGGAPLDTGTPPSAGGIRFAAELEAVPSSNGGGAIKVSYAVTYDALHFLRNGDGYRARYEVTVVLYDRDGRQVNGDSWRRTVEVSTYDETNERRTAREDEFEFAVPPGRYEAKVELRGMDTGAVGTILKSITVSEMKSGELTMGTVMFELERTDGDEGAGSALNPARIYGEEYPVARARVPVYGVPGTRYTLEYEVKNHRGSVKKARTDTVTQTEFLTENLHEFSVLDLEVGYHVLQVTVRPMPKGDSSTVRTRFRVVTSPLSWGEDEDKMLSQISYVATRAEMDVLSSVPPEERGPVWDEFWAARDPEPATEINEFKTEFLRRLGHANTEFKSIMEGWQTDMGRVYIQFGEPDDVDSQPVGQMLNAWEIWYYYGEHTKYVFVDRDGFGEFVLHEVSRI